jgi:guanylate kinase
MNPSSAQALLILISAPSGAGKTTLCQALLERDPKVVRAITCTTRAPRPGERDGVHYHFFDPARFAQHLAAGAFLEHASVHGNLYGTLKSEVLEHLRAGRDVLLNIDVQGAASIRAAAARERELEQALFSVFIAPPSLAELEARLRKRALDPEEVIQRRLAAAREEIAHWKEFDYLVVNDTLATGLQQLAAIVQAERLRQSRVSPPCL